MKNFISMTNFNLSEKLPQSYSFNFNGPPTLHKINTDKPIRYKVLTTDYGEYRILDCLNNVVMAFINSEPFDPEAEKLANCFANYANNSNK